MPNDNSSYVGVFRRIESNCSTINRESLQHMCHCFMTGRQCIFGSQVGQISGGDRHIEANHDIFVVMPFRPNLDTFYDWCLLPYLQESFPGIPRPNDSIRRADRFRDIGNVMCEKVCRRIQASRLVAVDITLDNANVFYELGLAVGLNKPLLLFCEDGAFEKSNRKRVLRGIGVSNEVKVVRYPNLGRIGTKEHPVVERVTKVELPRRSYDMKISSLIVPSVGQNTKDDISVDFGAAIEAAVRVSVERIEARAKKAVSDHEKEQLGYLDQKLVDAIQGMPQETIDCLKQCVTINLYDNGSPETYSVIANRVLSSFATIVDLASENVLSYFWLGFCHANGINVVPIYRNAQEGSNPWELSRDERHASVPGSNRNGDDMSEEGGKKNVLAFDMRALWYMDYSSGRPSDISTMLEAVLEELLIKDVMTQQRRAFWGRLARSGKLHIYTGGVHHPDINREMVGDWDLRTVSELVRYLSSADEPVVPKLERPIYAPETIREKLKMKDKAWGRDYQSAYRSLIKEELTNKNCLIVASADVNPLTEVLLWEAYKELAENDGLQPFPQSKSDSGLLDRRFVVALKKGGPQDEPGENIRLFSKLSNSLEKDSRGFLIDGQICQRRYHSQDDSFSKFEVLGHLVIMKNPYSEDNIVVLLNGVSGPGTFGLAEVLTGGEDRNKVMRAEGILRQINLAWERGTCETTRSNSEKFKGVEAFLEITIAQEETKPALSLATVSPNETYRKVKDKFFDKRNVTGWGLLTEKRIRNPREVIAVVPSQEKEPNRHGEGGKPQGKPAPAIDAPCTGAGVSVS